MEKVDNKQEDTATTVMSTDGKWYYEGHKARQRECERNDIKESLWKLYLNRPLNDRKEPVTPGEKESFYFLFDDYSSTWQVNGMLANLSKKA